MHVAVHLDIRPLNGAIHVLHSRSPKLPRVTEVTHACSTDKITVLGKDGCVGLPNSSGEGTTRNNEGQLRKSFVPFFRQLSILKHHDQVD